MKFRLDTTSGCPIALLLIGCAMWPPPPAAAQTRQIAFLKSNQTSKRNIGSAGTLTGKTLVHHIFCTDVDGSWPLEEQHVAREKMTRGMDFIARQSAARGQQVTFRNQWGRMVRVSGHIPTDPLANPDWTERVIRQSAGQSATALVGDLQRQFGVDNAVICLHVNKPALSYNLAYYTNVAKRFSAERMVCFAAYPDGRQTAAATYAHELLHLFGAGDLYFPYDQDDERKRVAGQWFPDDVMYRVDYDLGRLNIGNYTAFRVGWLDKLESRFTVFDD